MPIIASNNYCPPFLLRNGHLNTLYANVLRPVKGWSIERERVETPDGDFLDIDWYGNGNHQLLVMVHGLEGHAGAPYMKSMAREAARYGWDVVCMNLRGCSGSPNRLFSMYHSGKTEDLETILQHVLNNKSYTRLHLVGFSLGGNLVLKYLGEKGRQIPEEVKGFAGISVPFDLQATAFHLARPKNFLYEWHLIHSLRQKLKAKTRQFPGSLSLQTIRKIRDFESFDQLYTAPAHGFMDAYDYWSQCSAIHFLEGICIPGLVINAKDDPFLPPEAYPFQQAKTHSHLYLDTPQSGGHVGFVQNLRFARPLYHEDQVLAFFDQF